MRIRDTASSIRAIDTSPDSTSPVRVLMNSRQPLVSPEYGSMNMSTPALTEVFTWVV